MNSILFILLAVLLSPSLGLGQEDSLIEKNFLIVKSTTNFEEARKFGETAAYKLGLNSVITDCEPHPTKGFTCEWECGCGETHAGHVPRGRYDDGEYVSVEFSSAYNEFEDGYYIVVVASGSQKTVQKPLSKTQILYQDAYIKSANVYHGCMH